MRATYMVNLILLDLIDNHVLG